MQYAGAGQRFLAALVDGLILFVVQFLLSMVLGVALFDPTATQAGGGAGNAMLLNVLSWVISIGYYVGFQGSTGQTLGKKVMGIKVVNMQGAKPGYGNFALREVVGKTVSGIILGIGFLMILWDGRKQGLHDKIASTVVVKA